MPAHKSTVLFRIPARGISRRRLRDFAAKLQSELAGGRAFDVLLGDDAELQSLNRRFRKRDYPTDVLSFPSVAANGSLGDVAISLERAREQAGDHGHAAECEIEILMLHGVLHLLGLDHERDAGRMARTERRWRRLLGLPAGLIERVRG